MNPSVRIKLVFSVLSVTALLYLLAGASCSSPKEEYQEIDESIVNDKIAGLSTEKVFYPTNNESQPATEESINSAKIDKSVMDELNNNNENLLAEIHNSDDNDDEYLANSFQDKDEDSDDDDDDDD